MQVCGINIVLFIYSKIGRLHRKFERFHGATLSNRLLDSVNKGLDNMVDLPVAVVVLM